MPEINCISPESGKIIPFNNFVINDFPDPLGPIITEIPFELKSIERFLMNCKIQKIKELIRYENESLKQISFLLNYNSPSHMSNHFKKETGMTPSEFKKNMFS